MQVPSKSLNEAEGVQTNRFADLLARAEKSTAAAEAAYGEQRRSSEGSKSRASFAEHARNSEQVDEQEWADMKKKTGKKSEWKVGERGRG